jgi:hypothetical protein
MYKAGIATAIKAIMNGIARRDGRIMMLNDCWDINLFRVVVHIIERGGDL